MNMDSTQDIEAAAGNEELELKLQELYTANRNIERLTANVQHLESDVEYLKNALAEEKRLHEEAKKSGAKSKQEEMYRNLTEDLRQEVDDAHARIKCLEEEKASAEKRLQQVLEYSAVNMSSQQDFDADEFATLNTQLAQLEEENAKLQAELLETSMKLQCETSEKKRLMHDLTEKDEEIQCIGSQFTTQCNIAELLRDENHELKGRLQLETCEVDTSRKGNSLFSEVNDRREAAESKIVQLQQQMRAMEEKLTRELEEKKHLKNQISILYMSAKKGHDEKSVKTLQEQLVQAKKTIVDLTEQTSKLQTSHKEKPLMEFRKTKEEGLDDDKNYIKFLEGTIRTKTKAISEVRSQARENRLQCVRTELHLTQANNELHQMRHEVSQLKLQCSHLSQSLLALQHKYQDTTEVVGLSSKPRGMVLSSLHNTCNLGDGNSERTINQASQAASIKLSSATKENVRLRDIIDITDGKVNRPTHLVVGKEAGVKSKGVQLDSEVKVVSTTGDESTAVLREDGRSGKLARSHRGQGGSKFNSINVDNVADAKPSECNQQ